MLTFQERVPALADSIQESELIVIGIDEDEHEAQSAQVAIHGHCDKLVLSFQETVNV